MQALIGDLEDQALDVAIAIVVGHVSERRYFFGEYEVRAFTHFDRAQFLLQLHGGSAIEGYCVHGFLRRHLQLGAGNGEQEWHIT